MKNLILAMANLLVAAIIVMALFGINPVHAANMPMVDNNIDGVDIIANRKRVAEQGVWDVGFAMAAILHCDGLEESPDATRLLKASLSRLDDWSLTLMFSGHLTFIKEVKKFGLKQVCKKALHPELGQSYLIRGQK